MVTFTGASGDSCTGSELEVVVAVPVPTKSTRGQRRVNGGGEAAVRTRQTWSPVLVCVSSLAQVVPTCWSLRAFPGAPSRPPVLPERGEAEKNVTLEASAPS